MPGDRSCCDRPPCCSGQSALSPKEEARPSSEEDSSTSCCIFCGGLIPLSNASYNKRKRTLTSLSHFVTTRCQPTPYAYQYFSGVRGEDSVLLCISCVHWQRRACGQGKRPSVSNNKPKKRPLLFIDQFALFMLKPGTTAFPDQRCVLRLVLALQGTQKSEDWVPRLLLGLLPVPVQTMVLSIDMRSLQGMMSDSSVLNGMVKAWWEYNGRTSFFSHHLTAKLVRKVLKREREAHRVAEEETELLAALQAIADAAGAEECLPMAE